MMPQEELGETQILAAMLGIAEMVGGLTDTEEILASIVRIAPSLVRVDRCALMTYHATSREFRTAVSFGPGGRPTPYEGLVLPEGDMPRLTQRLVKQRLPVLMKDAGKESLVPQPVVQRLGMRSALIAPLVCRGRLLGAIWLDNTTGPHYFTSKEINVILGIATEAAIAMDNGQLGEALSQERRRFASLAGTLCDGVIVAGRDGRIVDLDDGAQRLLGWTTSETSGRRFVDVFEISDAEASVGWTKETTGPSPRPKDLRLRAHDGTRVACQVVAGVIRDDEGGVAEVLYALRKKPGVRGAEERAVEVLAQLADGDARRAPPE
jgi:PAS domain S-box-containing protein